MILHFIDILPGIYWFFIEVNKDENHINNNIVASRIKTFCNHKNITKIIRLDQDTLYWNKHNMYNVQIQKQILEMEEKKLFTYFQSKTAQIISDYTNYNKTLIISSNHTDTAIALFIYPGCINVFNLMSLYFISNNKNDTVIDIINDTIYYITDTSY